MFSKAMSMFTTTSNNALSMATPDLSAKNDGRLSLFFKAVRGITDDQLFKYGVRINNNLITLCFFFVFI